MVSEKRETRSKSRAPELRLEKCRQFIFVSLARDVMIKSFLKPKSKLELFKKAFVAKSKAKSVSNGHRESSDHH